MEVDGKRSTQSLSSQSDIEVLCEPCKRDNERAEGEFYCVNCTEYLCDSCSRSHRKSRASKDHKVINKHVSSESESEVSCDPCERDDEKAEAVFYCTDCDENLCQVCAKSHRKSRASVDHQIIEKHAVSKLENQIAKFSLRVHHTQDSLKKKVNDVNLYFSEFIADVDKFCTDIKTAVDTLREKSINEAEIVKLHDLATLSDASNTCENILTELSKISASVDDLRKTKQIQQLFKEAEKTRNNIITYETQLNMAVDAIRSRNYTFQSCENWSQKLTTESKLGSLVYQVPGVDEKELASESDEQITHFQHEYCTASLERKKNRFGDEDIGVDFRGSFCNKSDTLNDTVAIAGRSLKQLNAQFDKEILLKVRGDNEKCLITGCIEFDHCSVAFVDNNNSNVKLFNIETGMLTSQCKVRQSPWGITFVNPDHFVVSCKNKLVFLNKQLSVEREMKVDGTCQGITYGQGMFFVTFTKPKPALKLISHDGNVLKTFSKQSNAHIDFQKPEYIALCNDGHKIYISDCSLNTVTCITTDGDKLFVYKQDGLREPRGITVDEYNSVYIVGGKSNNVQYVSSDGKLVKVLLQEDACNGFWRPQSVGFVQSNTKMCVTHFGYGSNSVSIYNLIP